MIIGCATLGAWLGAVVAVVAHFLSHTLPTHYTVGYAQVGNSVDLGSPPLIRPSWWPSLLVAILIGLVIGLGAGWAASRIGIQIGRTASPN
jgi:hypothetical protein